MSEDRSMIEKLLPIRIISKVVRGFGRGSSDLGIPTANLDRETSRMHTSSGRTTTLDDLPCGIYWGFARIGDSKNGDETIGTVYKTALSIGFNPTYGNEIKTIEPHLIAPTSDPRRHASSCGETILMDFYDQPCRLSVVGYLRPELPFEGLEKLIEAIKNDIAQTEQLAETGDETTDREKEWVAVNEPL